MAGKARILTSGEVALLRGVFDQQITYTKVKLVDGPGLNPFAALALRDESNWAMTYLSAVHFNRGRYSPDFSAPGGDSRLLVHEIVHVWQYARLGLLPFVLRYGWNYVSCDCDQKAMYNHDGARHFNDATLEGQAKMVEEYYKVRARGAEDESLKAKLARTGFFGL